MTARPWTVQEVLEYIGWPVGKRHGNRWRTRCPVHAGGNESAFSYTDEVWSCFSCGEKGNATGLLRRFKPPLRGLRIPPAHLRHWLRPPEPTQLRASVRMARAAKAAERAVEDELGLEHRAAHATLRRGQRLLVNRATDRATDWRWELGGALVVEGWARLDAVDALLGCDCRSESGLTNIRVLASPSADDHDATRLSVPTL